MAAALEDTIKDSRIIDELLHPRHKSIMVIGAADTGKTTVIEALADALSRNAPLGIVDCDMGQSHIGPPTTVAWGSVAGGFRGWDALAAKDYYFTGATTPMGSFLPAVTGAKLMAEKAASSCSKVIIDTSGLIAEPAGRLLKQYKIDALAPDIVLALEAAHELQPILSPFRFVVSPKIFFCAVHPAVTVKSTATRSAYRYEQVRAYFAGARLIELPFEEVGIRFTREPARPGIAGFKNKIVSFRDERNKDIGLGVIEEVKVKEERFVVRTGIPEGRRFSAMVVGRTEIDERNRLVTDTEILK